ncbi:MAG TPA: BamA/TamA family outer membrane protein, partial [Flavitalea sp.]|nr:BamA/TamA family outer membrane protein [Flavitalea sp.]
YLVKGKPFDLEMIKGERDRIDARLKQRGYYYFNPDDILIDVDSTIGNNQVDLYVNLKPQTPKRARNHYRINEVVVYPTFSLTESGDDTTRKYAEKYRDYVVIDSSKMYKPKLFQQAMQFSPGDLYNRTEHNATLNRLINLGIFKFVKNRFEPVKNSDSLLNAYYYLTPLPKKSLRVELGGTTKSNNLTGSELTVGFTNRNAFRGGEILSVNVSGGFEVQYSGQYKGYNTYRLGAEGNLTIPRFVVPLVYVNPRGGFVPRTNIQLGYEVLTKQKLYTLNSLRAGYGYIWKETAKKEHTFYPISVQYVQPVNITDQYKASVIDNPTLAKVVDTQFILGATYNYLYTDVERRGSDNGFYFNGLLDISGNIAGLVKRNVIKGGDTARLFGAPFSQYLKTEFDFRYYRKLSQKNSWANRIILGVGFPYGNSKELPFIKQFFVGGNNSLRAFRSRSLGPGIYKGFGDDGFFPDQSGDIKLEINSELRFNIAGPVYGAMFVDAGNIWLYRENTYKPGAKFSSSFLKELAAGTGLGLRIDISILVLRLDVAFPIRKPWLPESERWVINDIKFGSSSWRKENLIFNLGIGYPF